MTLNAVAMGGCPDPKGRFESFSSHVIDAASGSLTDGSPLGMIPDITGQFLVGISTYVNGYSTPIQAIATVTFTPGNPPTVGMTLQTLSVLPTTAPPRLPVGSPDTFPAVSINTAGEFTTIATIANTAQAGVIVIPMEANPLQTGDVWVQIPSLQLISQIRSADRFCGIVHGHVVQPSNLLLESSTGTTFSAVRIPPGTTGSALPPVEVKCPLTPDADAGIDAF